MKFSVKAEYGLRAMIDLTLRDGQGPIGAKEIAARQDIPERFLEQQLTALKKAGLVYSQRGATGGCSLARSPQKISVLEIIEALEGPVIDMECLGSKEQFCRQTSQCVVQELWLQSQLKLKEFLAAITIEELAKRQQELNAAGVMFYI